VNHRLINGSEYPGVLRRAAAGGWLDDLLIAHFTPCDVAEARGLLAGLDLPVSLRLILLDGVYRGRARYSRRRRQYGILLPTKPGVYPCHLRVGLVLHEAAHIYDHQDRGKFGHGPAFCERLRELVQEWRPRRMANMMEMYLRHRGPYSLLLTILQETKGKQTVISGDKPLGPMNAERAHAEACRLVTDPESKVTAVFVFSDTEGQHIGAQYKRGETYRPWHEMKEEVQREGGMELSDQRPAATLLQGGPEPLRPVDAAVERSVPAEAVPSAGPVRDVPEEAAPRKRPAPTKLPGDRFPAVRGRALALDASTSDRWPKSAPAQLVKGWFEEGDKRATAAEVIQAIGPKLQALGMAHPASLVSRLKQGGFLKEVSE
jgi:hypothetical protein